MLGEDELQENKAPRPSTRQGHARGGDGSSLAGRTAGDSHSRQGSAGRLKRSESAILNDPEIWQLSDSEGMPGSDAASEASVPDGGGEGEAPATQEEDPDAAAMAKYLIERAPHLGE